jgi:dipeptidyl aminopeptidase/acylaminoacyl peptidase
MTTTRPHINRSIRLGIALAVLVLILPAASTAVTFPARAAVPVTVRTLVIRYTAHNGVTRHATVLLPAGYSPNDDPPIPLVISPHGRGGSGAGNAAYWGTLPTAGGFAVVNPDGMGRLFARYSYGDPGQIDDLARMPEIVSKALPWVNVDRTRVFALGSSMGGQETLLLVARHPELLAGAAAMDSVTNLSRRFAQLPLIPGGADLQTMMRRELGGTPSDVPRAFATRSPLSLARAIADSGVPLQIWWSTKDQIVVDQKHQSGALFTLLGRLGHDAPLVAYVGIWRHSTEMRSTSLLPLALIDFGILPHDFRTCPAGVHVIVSPAIGV